MLYSWHLLNLRWWWWWCFNLIILLFVHFTNCSCLIFRLLLFIDLFFQTTFLASLYCCLQWVLLTLTYFLNGWLLTRLNPPVIQRILLFFTLLKKFFCIRINNCLASPHHIIDIVLFVSQYWLLGTDLVYPVHKPKIIVVINNVTNGGVGLSEFPCHSWMAHTVHSNAIHNLYPLRHCQAMRPLSQIVTLGLFSENHRPRLLGNNLLPDALLSLLRPWLAIAFCRITGWIDRSLQLVVIVSKCNDAFNLIHFPAELAPQTRQLWKGPSPSFLWAEMLFLD